MKPPQENIHPIFDQILDKNRKEKLLHQKALVVWLTGLSGSGKSTIAKGVELKLHQMGFLTQILDGDNIRTGLNNNLGFSAEDRLENIRRIAEVSKLFLECGIITINSFVSPTNNIRSLAKKIIGEDFIEVFINCPVEICEKRDVKGLYKKAREGMIQDFTGVDAPFEAPADPEIEIRTDLLSEQESVDKVLNYILPRIKYMD